jgi:uncharacterized SAM-binding protein YcdF (DUF218 family)
VLLVVGAVVFLVVVLVAVLTARLFVWPAAAHPRHADAVVMLSGDHGERLPIALKMIHDGVASVFVHAGDPDTPEARVLCAGGAVFEVICLKPHPDSTRDEARAVGRLASARGWKDIAVVTSTQHVTRAGLLFRRCVKGSVAMVPARPSFDFGTMAKLVAHEWLGVVYALTAARAC